MVNEKVVSIPHRYGKNLMSFSGSFKSGKVSIPHRYGKNFCQCPLSIFLHYVSIPHRYGKNSMQPSGLLFWSTFPFLIGTVRTLVPDMIRNFYNIVFPFLIGTVRTEKHSKKTQQKIRVSIPHRYGKNSFVEAYYDDKYCFHSS